MHFLFFFFSFGCIQELKENLWLDLKTFSPEICDKGISDKEVSHNSMTTSVSFRRISCAVFSCQLWEFQNDSTVERKPRNTLLSYNLSFWSFRFWKYISDKLSINRPLSLPMWAGGKEPICQCRKLRRHGFDPWVGKIPGGGRATHSSILAWRILWTEDPSRL